MTTETIRVPLFRCNRVGCEAQATHKPVLTFASAQRPDGPRINAEMGLMLCKDHQSTDPSDYVTDQGWQRIVQQVRAMGRAYPSRDSLAVIFKPIL